VTLKSVARKDFTCARRSRALWVMATLFAVLTALIAFASGGYRLSGTAAAKNMFRSFGMVLAVLLPIVALVASYMAIAGERTSGGIKFLLGFPNTRRDVFLGKLASRLALVGGGLAFMFLTAAVVGLARYGTIPLGIFLGLFVVSLVYGSAFVSLAVSLSSVVRSKGRAIGAAVGSYFLLVVLYLVPSVRVSTLVKWLHHTMLGYEENPDLYNAVTFTSPYIAYRKAMNLVFPSELEQPVFRRTVEGSPDLPGYLADEFAIVVFAVWLAVPLVLGYLRFERSDLL